MLPSSEGGSEMVVVREASDLSWPPGYVPLFVDVDDIHYYYNHKAVDGDGDWLYVEYHSTGSQHTTILRVFND
jgi:hypothetical protein